MKWLEIKLSVNFYFTFSPDAGKKHLAVPLPQGLRHPRPETPRPRDSGKKKTVPAGRSPGFKTHQSLSNFVILLQIIAGKSFLMKKIAGKMKKKV